MKEGEQDDLAIYSKKEMSTATTTSRITAAKMLLGSGIGEKDQGKY